MKARDTCLKRLKRDARATGIELTLFTGITTVGAADLATPAANSTTPH